MITANDARELSSLKADLKVIGSAIEARARDGFTWMELPVSSSYLRDELRLLGYNVEPVVDAGHVYAHKVSWE